MTSFVFRFGSLDHKHSYEKSISSPKKGDKGYSVRNQKGAYHKYTVDFTPLGFLAKTERYVKMQLQSKVGYRL